MMATTHLTTGAAFGLAATATFHAIGHPLTWTHLVVAVAVSTGSALLPDIDHKSSRISKSLSVVTLGIAIMMRTVSHLVYEQTRGPLDPRRGGRHRGLTHTPAGALLCGLLVAAAALAAGHWLPAHGWWPDLGRWWWLGAPVFLGCIAHVTGDWLTEQGVPLLWPFKLHGSRWHHYHFPIPVSTNHAGEHFFWMPVFLFLAAGGAYFTIT